MSVKKGVTFTLEITNDSLVIALDDGILAVSVNCTTATSGTIEGDPNFKVGGQASTPLTVTKGTPITITAVEDEILDNITITAPAGCTLQIICQR